MLRNKLANKTSQKVYLFYYENLDLQGTREAVALTADGRDGYGGYLNANLWYVSNRKCSRFYSSAIVYGFKDGGPKLWKLKNTYMLNLETGGYGSGYASHAWVFTKNGAQSVVVPGMGITYKKNNQFCIGSSAYDASSDGTGHTYKNYYFYWNGKKFVEYGGIRITQAQLKTAKGAADVLKAIEKNGNITDIFYRSNGIVNINYRKYDPYMSHWNNYNVTLKLKGGKVVYDTSVNPYQTSKLDKATYYGIYKGAISNDAKYPEKFTLK